MQIYNIIPKVQNISEIISIIQKILYICTVNNNSNEIMASTDLFNISSKTFDSSAKPEMTKEEFVSEIQPKIQDILKRVFPNNSAKQKIRVHRDRISFAAPCCGDSAHDNYKKRGNIILEGKFKNLYKCFNCGTCMSVPRFLKMYNQDMSINMIDYVTDHNYTERSTNYGASFIYDEDEIEKYAIDREYFRQLLDLTECNEKCFGKKYLMERRQYNLSKFMYSIRANKLFVLNLTKSGKIFGIQVRSFNDKVAKYKTYGIQKLHQIILNDNVTVPDDINELSMIFNILLVDYGKYVTVTEGPMDSFLIKNSIALCGAGKRVEFPFMTRYMFDDDKPGREHAIERIKNGYNVFMWDTFKRDLGIKSGKKLDFNDVIMWCYNNNRQCPNINDYFSNNELDMIMI